MILENYQKQVEEAQAFRNLMLGNKAFSKAEIESADKILEKICSDKDNDQYIVHPVRDHRYLRYGLILTHNWYSNENPFKDPGEPLPRSWIARLILFREFFLLSQRENNPWIILDQICNLSAIKDYAELGCKEFDLKKHYFLHTSHTAKPIGTEAYNRIDKTKCCTILYPLYEGGVIGTIVTALAFIFQVIHFFGEKKANEREKSLKDNAKSLERLISVQKVICSQMILETKIREFNLINKINSEDGTVNSDELKEIYFNSYLPPIERLRSSRGEDCPEELREEQRKSQELANTILPKL